MMPHTRSEHLCYNPFHHTTRSSDPMNADAFRHFYNYHFHDNRKLWDRYITPLSHEQFTQNVNYSPGSVRDQVVHIISADDTWFSQLRSTADSTSFPPVDMDDRGLIRAHWDGIEQMMRD